MGEGREEREREIAPVFLIATAAASQARLVPTTRTDGDTKGESGALSEPIRCLTNRQQSNTRRSGRKGLLCEKKKDKKRLVGMDERTRKEGCYWEMGGRSEEEER